MFTEMTWAGELARWIGRLFPRIRHLECTDIGVIIKRGSTVKVLEPGLIFFWPIWSAFYCRPGNIQTACLPTQAITTNDGKIVVVGGMLRYKFNRSPEAVQKALVDTDDVEGALEDEAMGVFCAYITSLPMAKLQEERATVNRSLTGRLATVLASYGVDVLRAQLTDFSPCFTLNHVGLKRTKEESVYEEE